MFKYEEELFKKGNLRILALDEVGRGPLAGPIVGCGVVFTLNSEILAGVNDSKKLSRLKRETLAPLLRANLEFYISEITAEEIDNMGIGIANEVVFKKIYTQVKDIDHCLVDHFKLKFLDDSKYTAITKGDSLSYSIAAASIIAKVYRDDLMNKYDKEFPMYGFSSHKGYGTRAHINAIKSFGVCKHHRTSFLTRIA